MQRFADKVVIVTGGGGAIGGAAARRFASEGALIVVDRVAPGRRRPPPTLSMEARRRGRRRRRRRGHAERAVAVAIADPADVFTTTPISGVVAPVFAFRRGLGRSCINLRGMFSSSARRSAP
jgi:NAD(P)-dependent dehydrogenase (short-subunit alcohol dehydrogenase family)